MGGCPNRIIMSKFWFIPLTWAVYVLSQVSLNVVNATLNKPIVAYGIMLDKWFIFAMVLVTIVLEFVYGLYDKWLSTWMV